jgi:hypothetical protein
MPFSLALVQRMARLAGGLAILGVIVLSLVPGELRPHSGLPGIAEHFVFYLGGAGRGCSPLVTKSGSRRALSRWC